MSGRPTAEIVAELRDHLQAGGFLVFGQAADRLAELDAQNSLLIKAEILRPPCPTCGGDGCFHEERMHSGGDVAEMITGTCPDCVDGRMTFERMAAIVNAVFTVHRVDPNQFIGPHGLADYLRGVR